MMDETNQARMASLMNMVAGRGYPTDAAKNREVELEIMRIVRSLDGEKKSSKECVELLNGDWRLVFTTSEQLSNLSSIAGGPMKVAFESVRDDRLYVAAPFKGLFMLMVGPILMFVCLVIAILNKFTFLSAFFVTSLIFQLAAKYGPSGLFASRRTGLTVSDDMVVTSRLDRDVLALLGKQFSFDKGVANPMSAFCSAFDDSNGAKDALKAGFLFGWRLVPKPFCLHLVAYTTTRKEKIAYIDEKVRVMVGGDIAKDGTHNTAVTVFVRV